MVPSINNLLGGDTWRWVWENPSHHIISSTLRRLGDLTPTRYPLEAICPVTPSTIYIRHSRLDLLILVRFTTRSTFSLYKTETPTSRIPQCTTDIGPPPRQSLVSGTWALLIYKTNRLDHRSYYISTMLLRLLPQPTAAQANPPTILFTLAMPAHPYTAKSLPLPANLLAHKTVCLQEDLDCPNVLLGEKSSWLQGVSATNELADDRSLPMSPFPSSTSRSRSNWSTGQSRATPLAPSVSGCFGKSVEKSSYPWYHLLDKSRLVHR